MIALSIDASAASQTMEDRARTAADASRAKTSDSDAIRQNYLTPGLSGQPIRTVDDSAAFTPSIACQKTATMLEIMAQPSTTGDLGTVSIARDTDLDGTVDARSNLPMPVSGICANGIVSCAPGSWNGCTAFQWDIDENRIPKLVQVAMSQLAGCYCINNSCGANLAWSNMASVLRDLGGGVIGALTTADPRYGVVEAVIDGPVIRYVGAQSTACAQDQTVAQSAYRANPAAIAGDAATMAAGSSIFQMVKASPAGIGAAEETRACSVVRNVSLTPVTFDDVVQVSGAVQSVSTCGAGCRVYRIGGDGNCSYPAASFLATFTLAKPDRLLSARLTSIWAEDWVQARVNGAIVASAGRRPWLTDALPSGDCEVSGDYSAFPNLDLTETAKAGPLAVEARNHAGGGHRGGYLDVRIEVDTSCQTSERIVDQCGGYAGSDACRLTTESVDGVQTFRQGVATGLRPLPQTRILGSDTCSVQLTRDFFERDRSYRCALGTGSVTAPDLSRSAYILDHSTETMLGDRTRQADGSMSVTTRPFSLPDRGSVPACEAICKTRAPKTNNDAAIDGVVGARQNDPSGFDTFYHSCDSGNRCPVGHGEEIVSACGCLDDFPEAVAMMQTVRLAGADLVCTDSAR